MIYKNLLLIDDDEDDQEFFLTALGNIDSSIKCTVFDNGRKALEKLCDKTVTPDIIFLDLNMPAMSGQEFLMEVKKIDIIKDIPVVILTTSSHPGTKQLTKDLGAAEFVSKPERFEDLVN